MQLAERTQMVLFLRKFLFSLCALSINTNISADDSKDALALVEKEKSEVGLQTKRLESANQGSYL